MKLVKSDEVIVVTERHRSMASEAGFGLVEQCCLSEETLGSHCGDAP
jgi:hypothetical protein